MDIKQHAIVCQNDKLAVRVYHCNGETGTPSPTIILCNGFFGIQDLLLPAFARLFAEAGYTAVTFDYRGFGESEGEPGRIIPAKQIEDIIAVLDWCLTCSMIDARRIALWGTSLGGCHVVEAAVRRQEVKCVVSQMAFADGEQLVTGDMGADEKKRFLNTMERMAAKKKLSGKELFVPIIKVMTDEESRVFFGKNQKLFPALERKVPYLTVWEAIKYRPATAAAKITQPVLMVFAENDKVIALEYGLAFYQAIASEKRCHIQSKARHYDLFVGEHFTQVAQRQLHWLREYL
ncbi:alpha/beta hydrolase [Martelella alba]|uniref:Alpha/beta hydrolase n=1 Tax=Martelella alba TaxID=2590451 RepID=A0ABY2SKS6_9HYPH|nr:alpha/beta fold hydrolase [Martelella alba]TKI04857.1 alpha/beta hydrolase [Martelella alba]